MVFKEIALGAQFEKIDMSEVFRVTIASYDKKKVSLYFKVGGSITFNFASEIAAKSFVDGI